MKKYQKISTFICEIVWPNVVLKRQNLKSLGFIVMCFSYRTIFNRSFVGFFFYCNAFILINTHTEIYPATVQWPPNCLIHFDTSLIFEEQKNEANVKARQPKMDGSHFNVLKNVERNQHVLTRLLILKISRIHTIWIEMFYFHWTPAGFVVSLEFHTLENVLRLQYTYRHFDWANLNWPTSAIT